MAISTAVYSKTQFRCAIAQETTFGTAITTQSSFQELHITEPPTLDTATAVVTDETPRIDGSAVMGVGDIYKTQAGAITTVTVSGILTTPVLELLLEGVFQNKSSVTAIDTYAWDSSTSVIGDPDDQTFFTLALKDPIDGEGKQLTSAFLKTLEITWDAGSNGGRASFSATFISGLALGTTGTFTPASWTSPGRAYFTTSGLDTKQINQFDVVTNNFSFSFDNGATFWGVNSNGYAEGCTVGAAGGKGYVATGSISVKYDTETEDLIDKALANPTAGSANIPLALVFNDGDVTNQLVFSANCVLDSANYNFGQDAGVFRDLPFKCVYESTTDAISVIVGTNP
jgi:hypothetical protein